MDGQHGTGLELILNAAEGVLQIVVTEDEAILCAQEWYRSERATEILAPALAELATSLGIRWSDLRRIACVRGPGSFTGIRLTLATAAALRRCGRAQLAGLDYMQALATTAVMRRGMLYGGHVWVLTMPAATLSTVSLSSATGPRSRPSPCRACPCARRPRPWRPSRPIRRTPCWSAARACGAMRMPVRLWKPCPP